MAPPAPPSPSGVARTAALWVPFNTEGQLTGVLKEGHRGNLGANSKGHGGFFGDGARNGSKHSGFRAQNAAFGVGFAAAHSAPRPSPLRAMSEVKKLPPWAQPTMAEDLAAAAYPLRMMNSLTRTKVRGAGAIQGGLNPSPQVDFTAAQHPLPPYLRRPLCPLRAAACCGTCAGPPCTTCPTWATRGAFRDGVFVCAVSFPPPALLPHARPPHPPPSQHLHLLRHIAAHHDALL